MTINEFHKFVSEFRRKIAPAVRKHILDGNIELTNKMKTQLRELMGLNKDEDIPAAVLRYLPKAIEPQENPKEDELFILVTIALPKRVGADLKMDRANSVDVKIITKLYKDKVIFIAGGGLTEFKKNKSQYQKGRKTFAADSIASLDDLLPTFVRTKTVPTFSSAAPKPATAPDQKPAEKSNAADVAADKKESNNVE